MAQLALLWGEGQKRQEREVRARLGERFISSHDAGMEVAAAVAAAQNGKSHRLELPWYARPEEKRSVGLTGAELDKALAAWAIEFPDRVN
jgi:hypothetical protein